MPPIARGAALRARAVPRRTLSPARLRTGAILLGGAAGALARAGLAEAWPPGDSWPWATFVANLAGTALLAWLATRLSERVAPTQLWRPFLGTGLCGAVTTFSAFQIEAIRLAKDGRPGLAVSYVVVSLVLGLAITAGMSVLARRGRYG